MDELERGKLLRRYGGSFHRFLSRSGCLHRLVRRSLENFFKVLALTVELGREEMGVFEADLVEFLTGHQVVVGIGGWIGVRYGRRRQLNQFTIDFILRNSMDVAVTRVVPYSLGVEVHDETMRSLLVVKKGMSRIISPTTYIAADQAHPEVRVRSAYAAFIQRRLFPWQMHPFAEVVLRITANRTPTASPLLQTGAMKDVLAQDG
jgi:hypothetical protein